jgi:hypothetical protein
VKRSDRDETMWAAIHKCMEAMLGISLQSYLYLKQSKHYVCLIISYIFSSTKSENKRAEQVLPENCWGFLGGGGTNNVYTFN